MAIDNLAYRLNQITTSVCDRYNSGKGKDDPARVRRRLVVRGFNLIRETAAVWEMLKRPDRDPPVSERSSWKLPVSVAYWFLVILGSNAKGIRDLEEDDSAVLHQMRQDIKKRTDFENLRSLAARKMTWAEWQACNDQVNISPILDELISNADLLCITPAQSEQPNTSYPHYKYNLANGILIDEAANMTRADYACVAGNCLLPCIMGGDAKQLKPLVMTGNEKDELGYFRHRLAADGAISPLLFFQATGIPVYRLTQQLRMARGLFDWVAEEVYPELPLSYAAHCDVLLPQYKNGRALEERVQARFPDVRWTGDPKLSPLFLHCEGSHVYVDRATGSKLCPVQVKAGLDFAVDLVTHTQIVPKDIALLCPYAANMHLATRLLNKEPYAALTGIPPPSTVDAYQGQERDIVICVLGTAFPYPGPGFTTDENRLNVLMTRQRCGLVLVGEINMGAGERAESKGKGKGKRGKKGTIRVWGVDREWRWVSAGLLCGIYKRLRGEGRVMRVGVKLEKEEGKKEGEKGEGEKEEEDTGAKEVLGKRKVELMTV